MAFVKVGDAMPITSCYDKGEIKTCPRCGHPMISIKISPDQNEFVCQDCVETDKDEPEYEN